MHVLIDDGTTSNNPILTNVALPLFLYLNTILLDAKDAYIQGLRE